MLLSRSLLLIRSLLWAELANESEYATESELANESEHATESELANESASIITSIPKFFRSIQFFIKNFD